MIQPSRSHLLRSQVLVEQLSTIMQPIDKETANSLQVLPRYQYEPLDYDAKETRLAELLPGSFDDAIHIRIHHVALSSLDNIALEDGGFALEELQRDLPKDWRVRETVNGRFTFERVKDYGPQEPYETSYVHPTAKFEPVANNYNLTRTKPEYEALSHVWGSSQGTTTVYVNPLAPISRVNQSSLNDRDPEHKDTSPDALGRKRPISDDFPEPVPKRRGGTRVFEPAATASAGTCDVAGSIVSILPIKTELASALRHFRLQKRSRMMWIDSICMNQNDIEERSRLVRQMGQIYRLALRVIVWLGPEHSNSGLAMQNLDLLGRQVEITDKGSWRVNAPNCLHPTWSRTSVGLPWDQDTWDAVILLLRRAWFTRLWVWQEAKLANDDSIIQCGFRKMELYRFGAAAWCLAAKSSGVSAELQGTLFKAGDAVLRQFELPFLNTLAHLNGKECFDPRDKIYGALGLAPKEVAMAIVPDYNKEVEEVYMDATIALCRATERVDFLIACNLGEKTFQGPTWVPDWSVMQKRSPRWMLSTTLASGVSVSNATIIRTPKPTLIVQGVQLGTICRVGTRAAPENETLEHISSVIASWVPRGTEREIYDGGTESMFDAFVRTLHSNILRERCPEDISFPTFAEARQAMAKVLNINENDSKVAIADDQIATSKLYHDHSRLVHDRSFIELDNGLIGMTSATCEETDIVAVILGCPLAIVLRQHSSGRSQVVGPAYIHGRMDGEGFLGPLGPNNIVQVGVAAGWYGGCSIRNLSTDEVFEEDPRLGKVPASWVRTQAVRMPADPLHFVRFRDLATGKTINGDPRLLPDALRARGVPLKPLKLV
ncbi:hypothetical protein BST61_g5450 [Cercospora zeina]